jgi:hypothetical protein
MPDLPDACAALLELQHGVIARWQAGPCGLPAHVIDEHLRRKRWQPLYRGTYAAFTGEPGRRTVLWAAVLRAGSAAVLSHRTAAHLDGLADRPGGLIHVTVPAGQQVAVTAHERHRAAPGLRVYRSRRLAESRHPSRMPPRTRIEETALDLVNHSGSLDEALSWLATACGRRLTTPERLRQAAAARGRLRWRQEVSATLDDIGYGANSLLELRYVRDVERPHGLPSARRQARRTAEGRKEYLDNLYEAYRLGVELDGQAAHPVTSRWADIRRDNFSAVSGILTLRYGWSDVTSRPCAVAAQVAAVLQTRGWRGRPSRCGPCCALPPHECVDLSAISTEKSTR